MALPKFPKKSQKGKKPFPFPKGKGKVVTDDMPSKKMKKKKGC